MHPKRELRLVLLIRDNMNTSRHAVTIVVLKKKRIIDFLPQLKPIEGCLETGAELIDTLPPSPPPVLPEKTRTILALKTNLLYDAATAVNFAVEAPINRHFSVLYEQHTPWWSGKGNRFCLQFLTFGGEFRWWFKPQTRPETEKRVKRDALVGHFLGLYGWGGKLDFQNVRKICYQAEFNSLGLTYGYSMPIAKRFNMEFSISAGYAEIPYRHYNPDDEFDLLIRDKYKTGTWRYFGPTKVEVALVVPFLFKTKKGGRYERIY